MMDYLIAVNDEMILAETVTAMENSEQNRLARYAEKTAEKTNKEDKS